MYCSSFRKLLPTELTMTNISCGIDFGTSNSTCAISTAQGTNLIALELDNVTLPSTLFFGKEDAPVFGRQAVNDYINGEDGRFLKALKSVLGTSLMEEKTTINAQSVSFVEILTLYFKNLKSSIDNQAGADVDNVVLGRPVHFHDGNEQADKQSQETLENIARSVGFKNIIFQYEPIAAAFSHELNLSGEKLSLVIDLGGGTSDFTIIRLSPDRKNNADRHQDILATSGIRVGGTTFDKSLSLDSFMPLLGLNSFYTDPFDQSKVLSMPSMIYHNLSDWAKVSFAQTRGTMRETKNILRTAVESEKIEILLEIQEKHLGHALLQTIEDAKVSLTDQKKVMSQFKDLNDPFDVLLTRERFENSIKKHIHRISTSINECIKKAGVESCDIDLVILTGGSTELPIINELINEKFPHAEISNANKFGSVGLGLAYYGKNSVFY